MQSGAPPGAGVRDREEADIDTPYFLGNWTESCRTSEAVGNASSRSICSGRKGGEASLLAPSPPWSRPPSDLTPTHF